ncbi:MAG: hypothetical protein QG588_937 [Candidatus Poribacteria bacterium]|nr:hypothetical protein [Candidatus Poribacteria bacterium]
MKRILVLSMALTMVTAILILGIQYTTQAQRSEERPDMFPGMFDTKTMIMQELERSWTYLSLDMNITDEQFIKARKVYQESWIKYKEIADKSEQESGDRETMQAVKVESDKLKAKRTEKLKDILSEEEMKKLTEYENKPQDRNQRRMMPR